MLTVWTGVGCDIWIRGGLDPRRNRFHFHVGDLHSLGFAVAEASTAPWACRVPVSLFAEASPATLATHTAGSGGPREPAARQAAGRLRSGAATVWVMGSIFRGSCLLGIGTKRCTQQTAPLAVRHPARAPENLRTFPGQTGSQGSAHHFSDDRLDT